MQRNSMCLIGWWKTKDANAFWIICNGLTTHAGRPARTALQSSLEATRAYWARWCIFHVSQVNPEAPDEPGWEQGFVHRCWARWWVLWNETLWGGSPYYPQPHTCVRSVVCERRRGVCVCVCVCVCAGFEESLSASAACLFVTRVLPDDLVEDKIWHHQSSVERREEREGGAERDTWERIDPTWKHSKRNCDGKVWCCLESQRKEKQLWRLSWRSPKETVERIELRLKKPSGEQDETPTQRDTWKARYETRQMKTNSSVGLFSYLMWMRYIHAASSPNPCPDLYIYFFYLFGSLLLSAEWDQKHEHCTNMKWIHTKWENNLDSGTDLVLSWQT